MEDTLREYLQLQSLQKKNVLILIIMEDTLRVAKGRCDCVPGNSLNPYYNGRYSPRIAYPIATILGITVLILIIMEDTLRA